MASSGDLRAQLGVNIAPLPVPQPIEERLKALINQATVMLFMKGAPGK
jgi:hypothetical protein